MKIEDEQALKDAVAMAEQDMAEASDAYQEADEKLNDARNQLDEWFSLYS